MNQSVKTKSWTFVIVFIILFWPVGLYFLIQKLRNDKTAMFKSSVPLYLAGGFMALMGVAGLSIMASGEKEVNDVMVATTMSDNVIYIILSVAFFIGAFLVIKKALLMAKYKQNYKKYIELIINEQEYSIEHISARLSIVPDVVIRDLEQMIEKGIFKNAHIDRSVSMIVFEEVKQETQQQTTMSWEEKSVICPGCGAKNTIQGATAQCEYCGSLLK